ncbi:hypothetical protein EYF80_023844 [Liparis tanakae]|uniref:Uncharacterized protein n=1 Tax=Liparis tanakae TaxID=230148 RepID=A0A4Z2HK52_9TELE|nr:hypothetical protein EYF80_023844 [Liparis tanakae]
MSITARRGSRADEGSLQLARGAAGVFHCDVASRAFVIVASFIENVSGKKDESIFSLPYWKEKKRPQLQAAQLLFLSEVATFTESCCSKHSVGLIALALGSSSSSCLGGSNTSFRCEVNSGVAGSEPRQLPHQSYAEAPWVPGPLGGASPFEEPLLL